MLDALTAMTSAAYSVLNHLRERRRCHLLRWANAIGFSPSSLLRPPSENQRDVVSLPRHCSEPAVHIFQEATSWPLTICCSVLRRPRQGRRIMTMSRRTLQPSASSARRPASSSRPRTTAAAGARHAGPRRVDDWDELAADELRVRCGGDFLTRWVGCFRKSGIIHKKNPKLNFASCSPSCLAIWTWHVGSSYQKPY
jgi:hypothetical protein